MRTGAIPHKILSIEIHLAMPLKWLVDEIGGDQHLLEKKGLSIVCSILERILPSWGNVPFSLTSMRILRQVSKHRQSWRTIRR